MMPEEEFVSEGEEVGLGEEAVEAAPEEISEEAATSEGGEGSEESGEGKEEAPTTEPQKWSFPVNGEEREYTLDEIKELVNRADFADRSKRKFEEAAKLRKEAEEKAEQAERALSLLRSRPADVLLDLLTAEYGDEERAREAAVQQLEPFMMRAYEERSKDPKERELLRLQRERERLQSKIQNLELESQETRKRQEQTAQEEMTQKEELAFQNNVLAELKKIDGTIPNDGYLRFIYEQTRAIAHEHDLPFTPKAAAELLKRQYEDHRKALIGDKALSEAERRRRQDLEKAKNSQRKVGAGSRSPTSKSRPAAPSKPKRGTLSLDDLAEKILG